jgi:adenylate kinase family enzyme
MLSKGDADIVSPVAATGEALTRFPRRIAVTGTSGSGKTTVAGRIAAMAAVPHVELDALHWEPNWTPADPAVFRARVDEALAGDAWVVDGGYAQVRDLTWGRAEHLIWLDYSMPRALWQVAVRTFRRRFRNEVLWGTNREQLRMFFFSRESLFLWIVQSHRSRRRRYPEYFRQPELRHLAVTRVRTPRELEAHLGVLQSLLTSERGSQLPGG